MRLYVIFRYDGYVLLLNAGFLFISAGISAVNGDAALLPLTYSGLLVLLFGLFPLLFVPPIKDITNDEGLAIVVSGWLLSCLVGTIPYVLWGGEFTFTNAWFESVSGYTTTGSSILNNIEALPMGLLFWRNATHWIGGMGIIIFVLSVLPSMGPASMILYRSEMSPVAMESFHYRTKRALQILLSVYVGLTVLESIALVVFGMNLFDAVTTSFATIATGGFSPKNASIAYYHSVPIELIVIVFMVLSGIHFGLLFGTITGNAKNLLKSPVVRYYVLAMLVGIGLSTINLHRLVYQSWWNALRYSSFQIVSVGTSTGFANANSAIWPPLAQLLLVFFTLQCACAGSTS
ncbi:MAG TPA: TrkH family potassium uptake protein, partial [Bacteroidetes bacterium]|nr:TrkH family potassium uptake protein [Bacteroidota bacterium]